MAKSRPNCQICSRNCILEYPVCFWNVLKAIKTIDGKYSKNIPKTPIQFKCKAIRPDPGVLLLIKLQHFRIFFHSYIVEGLRSCRISQSLSSDFRPSESKKDFFDSQSCKKVGSNFLEIRNNGVILFRQRGYTFFFR